ncbi:hypothetical protein BSKO_06028 [Bryopsis sp. KO-2023]|nr:hypothetical protein BSKO_06028 [Bryopsis sp. KO-2023]
MLNLAQVMHDSDDPLERHPRYEKIRWASADKPNVQIALDRSRNQNVAIKFIERGEGVKKHARREIVHHRVLRHEHVVQFLEAFLTPRYLCVAMELGEQNLWQYVRSQGGRLPEDLARELFCQLLLGLEYCHSVGVANRDIKLENAVLQAQYHDGQKFYVLKICDFGYCQHSEKDSDANSLVGTSAYVSPEVLSQKKYDAKAADVWSCGVVLYFLIEGRFPFGTEVTNGSMEILFQRIRSLQLDPPVAMSADAGDLFKQILRPATSRININGILQHWWVKAGLTEYQKNRGRIPKVVECPEQSLEDLERIIGEARNSGVEKIGTRQLEQIVMEATLGDPDDVQMLDEYV